MSETVLVTGGTGFIGSHLCEKLAGLGYKVRVLAHYNSRRSIGNLVYLPKIRLEKLDIVFGDIRDGNFVRSTVSGCSIVFHLAALIGIPYSYLAPAEYFQTNVLGTINVLQACREQEVKRLVHTSTSEVYGTARYVPIDEQHPLQGQSPYSASKIGADKAVESFYCSFRIPVVTVRPFNTYGPRQSERAVIPTIIIQAFKGNKISLGDLSPLRDFSYVTDTVRGFLLAAEADGVVGEVINIGSGRCYSVREAVGLVAKIADKKLQIKEDRRRFRPAASEVRKLQCDFTKAKKLLEYQPKYSLEKGLAKTLSFYRRHLNDFSGKGYAV